MSCKALLSQFDHASIADLKSRVQPHWLPTHSKPFRSHQKDEIAA